MIQWKKFNYRSLDELKSDIASLGLDLPVESDLSVLAQPIELYGKTVKNRIATQPMEGFDGFFDGTPSDLTFRKYRDFSAGGVGMIWMESIATTANSKTCHRQLRMTADNLPVFQRLLYDVRVNAADGKPPYMICQLTYCGRGAHLDGGELNTHAEPVYIAAENPFLPRENTVILTDGQIDGIIDDYVKGAHLAKAAGFDAVDVRACHGYFLSEILSAYTRENSRYGGSFENRTRMMLTIVDRIRSEVRIPVVTRLNACDLVPYPYGWGMKNDGSMEYDLTEPKRLVQLLIDRGVELFNISLGRNHVGHIQGPANVGAHTQEHQLVSVELFQRLAAELKAEFPQAIFMTGNFAWPRQYSANIAAGGILNGKYDIAGFARMALAYPGFANDIIHRNGIDPKRGCVGCGMCSELCAASSVVGYPVGCVMRFPEIFKPYHQAWKARRDVVEQTDSPLKHYPLKLFDLKES